MDIKRDLVLTVTEEDGDMVDIVFVERVADVKLVDQLIGWIWRRDRFPSQRGGRPRKLEQVRVDPVLDEIRQVVVDLLSLGGSG